MTTIAVIQARLSSTRLPGKVLRDLGGRSVLSWVIRAAREAGNIDEVIVATSTDPSDDALEQAAGQQGVEVSRGPLDDVLTRFLNAIEGRPDATAIVRLTADCPLLDPTVIRACVAAFDPSSVDHLSTINPRSLPRGLDVEVVSAGALRALDRHATGSDRAHVTSALYRPPGRYRLAGLTFDPRADDLRITLDTSDDAALLDGIVAITGDRPVPWRDLVTLLRARPDLVALNAHVEQKPVEAG